MIAAIGAILPAILLGWLIVRLLGAPVNRTWRTWALEISLGAGVGLGITSIICFAMLLAGIASRAALFAVELIAIAALAMLVRRKRPTAADVSPPQPSGPESNYSTWALRLAAGVGVVCLGLSFSETHATNPNGEWDAFSVWNVRAKYLAGGSSTWRNAFAANMAGGMAGAAHPGYPLLISASVARVWTLTGETSEAAPAAISLLFALAACGLLVGAIAAAVNEMLAWLALLVLIATDAFVTQAAIQYADIPLAFFILATIAVAAAAERVGWPRGLLVLTGLAAGLAAFTKNEGLPFLLLIVLVVLWRARGAALWMLAGAVPGFVASLVVKLLAQGSEAVFPKSIGQALSQIADPSRWMQILKSFAVHFGDLGVWWAHPLLLIVVLAVTFGLVSKEDARSRLWLALPVAGLLAADFTLYLVTTAELSWHLSTSNARVILQVWPAIIFVAFLMLRRPAESEPATVARPVKGSPRK